jgi:NADH-ubiquinone oxidoreductase chain 4
MIKFIFLLNSLILIKIIYTSWWLIVIILLISINFYLIEGPSRETWIGYYREWGVDYIGFRLIILSFWIRILIIIASYKIKEKEYFVKYFIWLVAFLLLVLLLCFSSINLIFFYFFFEISLIPTLLIIIGWGFQLERLQSGVYFIFYTLTASLPLLLNLIVLNSRTGSLVLLYKLSYIVDNSIEGAIGLIILLRLIIAFLVKLPIFFTHLWLPKAHVEAPVAGSIILAGVLLKLGGFGLCRVMGLAPIKIMNYNGYMIGLGIISMIYVGFICWRLNDLKALVAYSSVSHIGLVFSGLVTMYRWGLNGGLIIIVRHGLSSSGLFCVVNIFYERLGSRRLFLNKGLLLVYPSLRLLVFLLCAANISAPPTINLAAEIILIFSLITHRKLMILFFPLGSFLGAVFTLFLFSFSQHGKSYSMRGNFIKISLNELHCLVLHIVPLNLLIIKIEFFTQYLNSLKKTIDCGAINELFFK